jgi:hypothetical protein
MSADLDRDALVALLEKLGSQDDAEVLDAARKASALIAAADARWTDVLASAAPAAEIADVEEEIAEDMPQASPGPRPADDEALALIDEMLSREGMSDSLKQELEDYKADIAAGEFSDIDRDYLRALHTRLGRPAPAGPQRPARKQQPQPRRRVKGAANDE